MAATTYVRVEYATSAVADLHTPTTWYFLARPSVSGTVVSAPPQKSLKRVWYRQRTERAGFAPTPWLILGSVVVDGSSTFISGPHIDSGSELFSPTVSL